MSVIDSIHAPAASRSMNVFGRISAALADWHHARTTRDALHRLTDRELDDIGLSRGDIERVARGL